MKNYFKKNAFMLTGQALSILFMGAVTYAALKDIPHVESSATVQTAKAPTLSVR